MKKIAVLHRYPITEALGTNASFVEFLKALSQKEMEVYYITYRENRRTKKFSFIKYLELPFTFDRWNNRDKMLKTALWIVAAPIYVSIKTSKNKFDLIYCDDSVPYYGFLTKLLNFRTKVFIRLGDLQSGYAWADKNPKLFRLILKMEKSMWRIMDGIVAISEPFKDFIVNQIPYMKDKVFVVEESVNLVNLSEVTKKNQGQCVFLFHGALVSCKGVELLLEAFADFVKKYSDSKLIIAGGGPEEARLKALTRELNLCNIEFTGRYNHERLIEIMKNIDVSIVMRSPNMANNFVVTTCLLENWSYKKPVIVPDLAAFRRVIRNEKNGILFKPGDKADLIKKMEYMYKHRSNWQYLGENGWVTAKSIFSHTHIAEKMANILVERVNNVEN